MSIISSAVLLLQAKNYSGSGNWLDESGNGHHATPVGSPTWDGQKFTLNGTTDAFTVADHADFAFAAGDSFTIIADGALTSLPPSGKPRFLSKQAANVGFRMYVDNATSTYLFFADDVTDRYQTGGVVTLGARNRLTLRVDASGALSTAGVYPASNTAAYAPLSLVNTSPLTIGANDVAISSPLTGDIYAVAIWRRALSDTEVAQAIGELINKPKSMSLRGV